MDREYLQDNNEQGDVEREKRQNSSVKEVVRRC